MNQKFKTLMIKWGPEQVWGTYSEKLKNSNRVRSLVSFCESGAVRKLVSWLYSTFYRDKSILFKLLEPLQFIEFV